MTTILKGILKHNTIELLHPPPNLPEGPVQVIVVAQESAVSGPGYLTFGKYRTGKESTLEDFQVAQWHGEAEFDDSHGQ